jgi:hypothetical protein
MFSQVYGRRREKVTNYFAVLFQSGGGPPHSKTLARRLRLPRARSAWDCASPLALWAAGGTARNYPGAFRGESSQLHLPGRGDGVAQPGCHVNVHNISSFTASAWPSEKKTLMFPGKLF